MSFECVRNLAHSLGRLRQSADLLHLGSGDQVEHCAGHQPDHSHDDRPPVRSLIETHRASDKKSTNKNAATAAPANIPAVWPARVVVWRTSAFASASSCWTRSDKSRVTSPIASPMLLSPPAVSAPSSYWRRGGA